MKIAVVGLGYVGLPLAIEFGKSFSVVGLDISKSKIEEFQRGRVRDGRRRETPWQPT